MKTPFRTWLREEAEARDPAASLAAIEARTSRPRRRRAPLLLAACATLALFLLALPRDEVTALAVAERTHPRSPPLEFEMHTKTSRFHLLGTTGAVMLSLVLGVARAAETPVPAGAWAKRIDIELKDVEVAAALQVVASAAGSTLETEPCVAGRKIDLKLKNVPLQLVLDALTVQLGLTARTEGTVLRVGCRG